MGLSVLLTVSGIWLKSTTNAPATADKLPITRVGFTAPLDSTIGTATGLIGAGPSQPLTTPAAGRVLDVFFMSGEYVHRGQLLVKLSSQDYVTAPHDGFLGANLVTIGQYLPVRTPVTTISALGHLVVTLASRSRDSMRPGDSVRVWVASRPARVVSAVVGSVAAGAPADAPLEIVLAAGAPFRIGERASVQLHDHRGGVVPKSGSVSEL